MCTEPLAQLDQDVLLLDVAHLDGAHVGGRQISADRGGRAEHGGEVDPTGRAADRLGARQAADGPEQQAADDHHPEGGQHRQQDARPRGPQGVGLVLGEGRRQAAEQQGDHEVHQAAPASAAQREPRAREPGIEEDQLDRKPAGDRQEVVLAERQEQVPGRQVRYQVSEVGKDESAFGAMPQDAIGGAREEVGGVGEHDPHLRQGTEQRRAGEHRQRGEQPAGRVRPPPRDPGDIERDDDEQAEGDEFGGLVGVGRQPEEKPSATSERTA